MLCKIISTGIIQLVVVLHNAIQPCIPCTRFGGCGGFFYTQDVVCGYTELLGYFNDVRVAWFSFSSFILGNCGVWTPELFREFLPCVPIFLSYFYESFRYSQLVHRLFKHIIFQYVLCVNNF